VGNPLPTHQFHREESRLPSTLDGSIWTIIDLDGYGPLRHPEIHGIQNAFKQKCSCTNPLVHAINLAGPHRFISAVHLSDLSFRLSYRTGRDDLVQDFFNPCLEASVLYRHAAGYFTSAGLALAARGVASLAVRGGTMRLVVSPYLEPDDVEALQAAIG